MKENMTPKEIVSYLDGYIIGQYEAKKAVAIALRNRYRRMKLDKEVQEEITPKNIRLRKKILDSKTREREARRNTEK